MKNLIPLDPGSRGADVASAGRASPAILGVAPSPAAATTASADRPGTAVSARLRERPRAALLGEVPLRRYSDPVPDGGETAAHNIDSDTASAPGDLEPNRHRARSASGEPALPRAASAGDVSRASQGAPRLPAARPLDFVRQRTQSLAASARNLSGSALELMGRDLNEAMTTRHDLPNLSRLSSQDGIEVSPGVPVSLQSLHGSLDAALESLRALESENPALHARFERYIRNARASIDTFDENRNRPPTPVKAGVAVAANAALLSLPWLLATDPMKVKEVAQGESRLSKKFMLVMAGYQAKTLALLVSHTKSPVSNASTLGGFLKERHAYDIQGFITAAPATFSKAIYDRIGESAGYSVGRSFASGVALNLLFQSETVGHVANKLHTGVRSLATTGTLAGATAYPRVTADAQQLGEQQRNTLSSVAGSLDRVSEALYQLDKHLHDTDATPSVTWSQHVSNARRSLNKAAVELRVAAREESPPQANNPDKFQKQLLAAAGGIVYAVNALSVLNDSLALADVIGDAMFAIPILLANAYDPSVTAKGAKDDFKSYVGTSLVSMAILGINAMAGDPIGKSDRLFYVMLPIFAGLALTAPSPMADAMVNVLDKMFACVQGRLAPRGSDSSGQADAGDIEMPVPASVQFDGAAQVDEETDISGLSPAASPAELASRRQEFVAAASDYLLAEIDAADVEAAGRMVYAVGDAFVGMLERDAAPPSTVSITPLHD